MKKYYNIKPKRIKSVFKIRPKIKINKIIDSNNSAKINNLNFPSFSNVQKAENARLLTEYTTLLPYKQKLNLKSNLQKSRTLSVNPKKSKLFKDLEKKKYLRGKLRHLVKNNIILCENKFNPKSFTESISHVHVKEFKNRFRNINNKNKVGIFTNKFPAILNINKFYSRYFDYFISPDELLNQNFNKKEIFQIKTDPNYFNFGNNFNYVSFFRKKTLKETLNEEDKIGSPEKLMDMSLKKSLKQTKKRVGDYLNYYTSVMSRQGFIGAS